MEMFSAHQVFQLVWLLNHLVDLGSKLPSNPSPQKRGGYLTLLNEKLGLALAHCAIGEIPVDKAGKYDEFSCEKAQRLLANHNHISSWQSRDPDSLKWGGAIRAGDFILSFSGLPELLDEAVVTAAAYWLELISDGQAFDIAAVSDNSATKQLIGEFGLLPPCPHIPGTPAS